MSKPTSAPRLTAVLVTLLASLITTHAFATPNVEPGDAIDRRDRAILLTRHTRPASRVPVLRDGLTLAPTVPVARGLLLLRTLSEVGLREVEDGAIDPEEQAFSVFAKWVGGAMVMAAGLLTLLNGYERVDKSKRDGADPPEGSWILSYSWYF